MGENWGLQLQYDHLSHGQILGNGRNQGLDNIGVRVYWQFQ
jgi:lipid A 3-O-deacylase